MSRPPATGNGNGSATTASSNGNVAASGDPFYVFKEELESKVASVHQRHAKWKAIFDAKESPQAKELPALTAQLAHAVTVAEKSLKFLEQTIASVEANRSKFGHIDNAEIASRKAFVASARSELQVVSTEISSEAVKRRIQKEERKLMKPLTSTSSSAGNQYDDNARFLEEEKQRQNQLMKEQDQNLEALSQSVKVVGDVALEINHEIKTQNKMLDDLTEDVVEAQERMNFVMDRMSRLLKTKDKCQLGLIIFLVFVLVVMVFLVIYT
uniref:t-SNARE coiled-coil homology domain-containing protein n=1 Tax=Globisporangium ultimum (strain ATCC 200006 / CBS 805.95 / DAOM BR144) TaxID=431595 RepID=K3X9Q8_GLOUD